MILRRMGKEKCLFQNNRKNEKRWDYLDFKSLTKNLLKYIIIIGIEKPQKWFASCDEKTHLQSVKITDVFFLWFNRVGS